MFFGGLAAWVLAAVMAFCGQLLWALACVLFALGVGMASRA
jgi:hypothetical protein